MKNLKFFNKMHRSVSLSVLCHFVMFSLLSFSAMSVTFACIACFFLSFLKNFDGKSATSYFYVMVLWCPYNMHMFVYKAA